MASITIRDVAKRANVSIKTVSRVLNDEQYVAKQTRVRVENAISNLGYVSSLPARRLASGQSFTLGLLFHDASWHYYQEVQRGVMETAFAHGYHTLLHLFGISENDEKSVLNMVHQNQVDGLIFTPPTDHSKDLINSLVDLGVPFVSLSPFEKEDHSISVSATDEAGAFEMTNYLIGLGHHRIGFIFGPKSHRNSHNRFAGYKRALREAHIQFDEEIVVNGDDLFDSGVIATKNLIALDNQPTAIFCNNDEMAAGAITAVFDSGLSVPNDISVAGFDNISLSTQIWPPLTTIDHPVFEIANLATEKLIKLLKKESVEKIHSVLPTKLIARRSTAQRMEGQVVN